MIAALRGGPTATDSAAIALRRRRPRPRPRPRPSTPRTAPSTASSPVALLDDRLGGELTLGPTPTSNPIGCVTPTSVSSPCTCSVFPSEAASTAVDLNAISMPRRTSPTIVSSMFALSSSSSGCIPPVPWSTRRDAGSASKTRLVSAEPFPSSSVASHPVTRRSRSWPALAAAPPRPVRTKSVAFSGPSLYVPAGIGMRRPVDWLVSGAPVTLLPLRGSISPITAPMKTCPCGLGFVLRDSKAVQLWPGSRAGVCLKNGVTTSGTVS